LIHQTAYEIIFSIRHYTAFFTPLLGSISTLDLQSIDSQMI